MYAMQYVNQFNWKKYSYLTAWRILLALGLFGFACNSGGEEGQKRESDATEEQMPLSDNVIPDSIESIYFLSKVHSEGRLMTWETNSEIQQFVNQSYPEFIRKEGEEADEDYLGIKFSWPANQPVVYFFGPNGLRKGRITLWHQIDPERDECGFEKTPARIEIEGDTQRLEAASEENPLPVFCILPQPQSTLGSKLSVQNLKKSIIKYKGDEWEVKGIDMDGDQHIDLAWSWQPLSESANAYTIWKKEGDQWQIVGEEIYQLCI